MACFPKIFSKKKKQKKGATDPFDPLSLEDPDAVLLQRHEDLERQIAECNRIVTINIGAGSKTMAMRALQKKRRLEKNLEQVDQALTTLDLQRDALEDAKTNAAILGSLKKAGKALKRANVQLDNTRVQTVMDEITEQHYVGNEISTAIRKSLVIEVDEDTLEKELEELQDEAIDKQILEKNKAIVGGYPSIPTELDDSVFANQGEKSIKPLPLESR